MTAPAGILVGAVRWRLAATVRGVRFVPALVALVGYLLVFFSAGGQSASSALAIDIVAVFALALWFASANTTALSAGHRAITQVTVGAPFAFAAEVLSGCVLALATAVVVVVWPVALVRLDPLPGAVDWALAALVVAAAGVAGVATAQVLHAARLRPPVRFVVAVGIVAVVLARPNLAAAQWVVPPVMDAATAAHQDFPVEMHQLWWASAGSLGWAVLALAVAYRAGRRIGPGDA